MRYLLGGCEKYSLKKIKNRIRILNLDSMKNRIKGTYLNSKFPKCLK